MIAFVYKNLYFSFVFMPHHLTILHSFKQFWTKITKGACSYSSVFTFFMVRRDIYFFIFKYDIFFFRLLKLCMAQTELWSQTGHEILFIGVVITYDQSEKLLEFIASRHWEIFNMRGLLCLYEPKHKRGTIKIQRAVNLKNEDANSAIKCLARAQY